MAASDTTQGNQDAMLLLYRTALLAHKHGDYQKAAKNYQQLLAHDPNRSDILLHLSHLAKELNDQDAERDYLNKYLQLVPTDPHALIRQGHLFCLLAHQKKMGLEYLLAAKKYASANNEVYHQLGAAYLKHEYYEQSIEAFKQELMVNPANTKSHMGLALAYLRHDQEQLSRPHFQQVLKTDPTLVKTHLPTHQNVPHPTEAKGGAGPKHKFVICSYPKCGTYLLSDVMRSLTGLQHHWPSEGMQAIAPELYQNIPAQHFLLGHWFPDPEFVAYLKTNDYRVIVQLRDPRDQLVSFYHYQSKTLSHHSNQMGNLLRNISQKQALSLLLAGSSFAEHASLSLTAAMVQWVESWQKTDLPILFTRFEDMVNHKAEAVGQLADFIGMPYHQSDLDRVIQETAFEAKSQTLSNEQEPQGFKRKGQAGDWQSHFDDDLKHLTKTLIGMHLIGWGYEEDFNW
ncbi:sulfotransferase domain-containing protein [Magnetococcus sp. PR-3]|uniref:sulfotransferase domain-containing protein n=1 Tax=Magnetococcus sp. PR-3 TaxID=3120355 RepID=UPI002FCE40D3